MPKNVEAGARRSTHINRRNTQSIFRAFDYATYVGKPLNTYVVIRIKETAEASAVTIFTKIRHKFRDWLAYHEKKRGDVRTTPGYTYAFENPNGTQPHVNWAVHVPAHLQNEFQKKLHQWVARVQGAVFPFDISCGPIKASHAKRLAKYIVKGTDPAFVPHFYLEEVHEPQGEFWGKRAGCSTAIGAAARKKAGFKPRRGRSFKHIKDHHLTQVGGQESRV